jgi:hypothetical protein
MNLAEFLKSRNYCEIALQQAPTGHLELTAHINGQPAMLLLDTGAGKTALDLEAAKTLGLALEKLEIAAGGLGTSTMAAFRARAGLQVGGVREAGFTFVAVDLSHVNRAIKERGANPCAGVLGADILESRCAVIDYKNRKLYLRND